jgi:hypothetical protein
MTLVVPGKTTANEHEEKQIENWLPLVWTSIRFSSCLFAVKNPRETARLSIAAGQRQIRPCCAGPFGGTYRRALLKSWRIDYS